MVKDYVTESDEIWTCVYEPVDKKFPDLAIESIVATGKPGVVSKPDLIPTLSPIHARDVPTIIVVVKNVGDEAAFDFAVSLELSPSRPEFAEESALLQLGPGKRITVAFTCPFLDPGTYEAYAFADCNEAVEEWDERDNNFKNIEFNALELRFDANRLNRGSPQHQGSCVQQLKECQVSQITLGLSAGSDFEHIYRCGSRIKTTSF